MKTRSGGKDILIVVALGAFAYWSLGFLLRDDLYLFGDNPGQFYRLWYPMKDGLEGLFRLTSWNPSWYAGFPELQFYPPGFVILGILINVISFDRLSPFQTYEALRFFAYYLPALTTYALFRWLRTGTLTAFAAAFFTLLFPDIYGGIAGVQIGMLGDRIALGLYPLALLAGIWGMENRRSLALVVMLGAILAAVVLLHPFQAPAPLLSLVIYVTLRGLGSRPVAYLALAVLLAAGLIAVWLVPLVAHSEFATPVLRASIGDLHFWLLAGRLSFFIPFAALGLTSAFHRKGAERAALLSIGLTPVILLALILADFTILVDRLGFYTLDPIRFIETLFLCVAILAGVGLADLIRLVLGRSIADTASIDGAFDGGQPLTKKSLQCALERPAGLLNLTLGIGAIAAVVYVLLQPSIAWRNEVTPKEIGEPRFLGEAAQRYGLDSLWTAIQSQPPGRVLVVSSQLRLRRSGDVVPTYLFALLPYFTGRETIGGTFHHWSPVATYYWYGRTQIPVMKERTDLMDDHSLFGEKWDSMDEDRLYDIARSFGVSTVVATEYDGMARAFLDKSKRFGATYNDGTVVLYGVNEYVPGLLDFDPAEAAAELTRYDSRQIDVMVKQASEGAQLGLKVAYYPLWTAEAQGQQVQITADEYGLMRLHLPAGAGYQLSIRYAPKLAEQLGIILSIAAFILVAAVSAAAVFKKTRLVDGRDQL